MATLETSPSPATAEPAAARPATQPEASIYLSLHVQPLLDAIAWMGSAGNRLCEVESVEKSVPLAKSMLSGVAGPDDNGLELMSSLAWLAGDLVHRYREQTGAE